MIIELWIMMALNHTNQPQPQPTSLRGKQVVAQAGLSAHALAASGCTIQDVDTTVRQVLECGEARSARASALDALGTLTAEVTAIEAALSEAITPAARAQRDALVAQRESLVRQLSAAEETLFDSAASAVSDAKAAKLAAIRRAKGHALPIFWAASLPENCDPRQVRIALIAQRRATRLEVPVSSRHQAVLASVNTVDVATAEAALNSNGAAIAARLESVPE